MRCFEHDTVEAVAVCKHCGRALCRTCVVESEEGVSCAGRCADQLEGEHVLMKRSRKALGQAGRAHLSNALFMGVIGLAFFGYGFALGMSFLHGVGVIFVAWAAITFTVGRKMKQE